MARRELRESRFAIHHSPLAFLFPLQRGEAERRQTQIQPPRLRTARARRSAHACRRSTAALTSGNISPRRLGFRPGFLGRGLNGRYPPSPVPAQGCTSHPGRNAGRHDAQAARERTANPPAGTALAPTTQCASAPCPSPERGLCRNRNGDDCQGVSPKLVRRSLTPRHNVRFTPVSSTGQCNTSRSLSAGVLKPKVFRGR